MVTVASLKPSITLHRVCMNQSIKSQTSDWEGGGVYNGFRTRNKSYNHHIHFLFVRNRWKAWPSLTYVYDDFQLRCTHLAVEMSRCA